MYAQLLNYNNIVCVALLKYYFQNIQLINELAFVLSTF